MHSKCTATGVALSLVCLLGNLAMAERPEVVAEVNGKPIPKYRVWQADRLHIQQQEAELSEEARAEMAVQRARGRLAQTILSIIQEAALESLETEPAQEAVEAELEARLAQLTAAGGSLEDILETSQLMQVLIDALREAAENPETAESVYDTQVAPLGVFDAQAWELYLVKQQHNPARIDEMEAQIPESVDDVLATTREGIVRSMRHELLRQEIAGADTPIAEANARLASHWLDLLEDTEIVIHDDALSDAVDLLKEQLELQISIPQATPGAE